MKKPFFILAFIGLTLYNGKAGNTTRYVNPFIGTGAIEGGLSGNNYPGATVPFGMVQLSPDTREAPDWAQAAGYDYNDNTIYGFSHTRLSGTGASDLIDILMLPTTTILPPMRLCTGPTLPPSCITSGVSMRPAGAAFTLLAGM